MRRRRSECVVASAGSSSCVQCVSNKFKAVVGTQDCKDCPSNSHTWNDLLNSSTAIELTGSTRAEQCICDIAYFGTITGLDTASGSCTACPINTFKAIVGSELCHACPDNSNSPELSNTADDCLW